jgi:hypothetical protein
VRIRLSVATIVAASLVAISGGVRSVAAQGAPLDSTGWCGSAATQPLGARASARGVVAHVDREGSDRLETNGTNAAPAGIFDDVSTTGVLLAAVLVIAVVYTLSRTLAR